MMRFIHILVVSSMQGRVKVVPSTTTLDELALEPQVMLRFTGILIYWQCVEIVFLRSIQGN
jgi:hypothetical protein